MKSVVFRLLSDVIVNLNFTTLSFGTRICHDQNAHKRLHRLLFFHDGDMFDFFAEQGRVIHTTFKIKGNGEKNDLFCCDASLLENSILVTPTIKFMLSVHFNGS